MMQIKLYIGVMVAPQILPMIDINRDDIISETESEAYIDLFLDNVVIEIDRFLRFFYLMITYDIIICNVNCLRVQKGYREI